MAIATRRIGQSLTGGDVLCYEDARIPLSLVNVLPQARVTFTDIDSLSENIARRGQLMPLVVAKFTRQYFQDYIDLENRVWGTTINIGDFTSFYEIGEEYWYVLIDGERRYRALSRLSELGCESCQAQYGSAGAKLCYSRHFGDDCVRASLILNVTSQDAIDTQYAANTHTQPPPEEEAIGCFRYYLSCLQTEPDLTPAQFAHRIGRKPEVVKNYLRFANLPQEIRDRMKELGVSYGIGIQLARLQESQVEIEHLENWLVRSVVMSWKVEEMEKAVNIHLKDKASGQPTLADLMGEIPEPTFSGPISVKAGQDIFTAIGYFRRLIMLFEKGMLKDGDSPFNSRQFLEVVGRLIAVEKEASIHMMSLLKKNGKDPRKVLLRAEQITLALQDEDGEDVSN